MNPAAEPLTTIGWREWLTFPELCESPVKAKIDTGARTSAMHAFDLRVVHVDGVAIARFELHPHQRSAAESTPVELPIRGYRRVRSSNGRSETRPVVITRATLGPVTWPIELTLTSRDAMGFRLLLGRAALRRRFMIDPGRSFVASRSGRSKPAAQPQPSPPKGSTRPSS